MNLSIFSRTKRKLSFFIVIIFFFHELQAQNQSLGGGIGINTLYSNGVNLSQNQTSRLAVVDDSKRTFSKPQMSLNIDYNFPNILKSNLLGRIYNPIFSSHHLQLRGQAMFNQFRISKGNNNSILSFGGSLLYFPVAYVSEKKINIFVETGYKAAWNNAVFDPFHCFVLGIGTRHNLGNDVFLQANINYTFAFNDYVDQYGLKGFTIKNSDGYALFNISILKSFLTVAQKKAQDGAKDSLGMARSFAVQAILKGQKVTEDAKSIQKYIKPLLEKTQIDKNFALKISETAFAISNKAVSTRLNLQKDKSLDNAERVIDSLKAAASTLLVNRLVDYEKASDAHLIERDIAKKVQELQRDTKEAQQNLKFTFQYLPFLKELETEVQRINIKEGGEARVTILNAEKAIAVAQKEFDAAQKNVLETIASFEKADKNLKNALEDIEKTKKEIAALKR